MSMANLGYRSTMTTTIITITADSCILRNYPRLIIEEIFQALGGKDLLLNGISRKQHIMVGISCRRNLFQEHLQVCC